MSAVTIALKAEGVDGVKAALKGVKQATTEADDAATAAVETAAKKRTAIRRKELDDAKSVLKQIRQEESFSSAINGGARGTRSALVGTTSGAGSMDRLLGSVAGGEGLGGLAKAAGVAGIAFGVFKTGIDLASSALRTFAGFLLSDVVKPAWALETKAQQVANNSMGQLTAADVEKRARAVGIRNNMSPMDVVEAAGDFQNKTGQPRLGFEMLDTIGMISKGRGFGVKDLTGLAGALYKPGMGKAQLDELMLGLTAQGAQGSVTIGELARLGGRFTAPAESLAGSYRTRIAEVGALVQSAKPGIGSVDETASAVQAFMRESMKAPAQALSARSFVTEASGVRKLADASAFIGDIYRKTQGNAPRLTTAGFTEESQRLIRSYAPTYEKGFEEAKSAGKTDSEAKEAGAQAVETFIRSLMTASTTMGDEAKNRDAVMRTSGEKWAAAIEQIKTRLLEAMPAINKFAGELVTHAPALGQAAITLANALIFLAEIVKGIAGFFGAVFGKNANVPEEAKGSYQVDPATGKFHFVKREGPKVEENLFPGLLQPTEEQAAVLARGSFAKRLGKPEHIPAPLLDAGDGPAPALPPLSPPGTGAAGPAAGAPGAGGAPATAPVPASAAELHDALAKLAAGAKTLDGTIADLNASIGGLSRNKPFSER